MDNAVVRQQLVDTARLVQDRTPLVGSVTNTVTINFVANAQLAVGGSAAMVYLPDEAEFLAQTANAMYVNVGTLLPIHEEVLPRLTERLHELSKPWVLDPVGIGIGKLRTRLLKGFKQFKPTIIRGNASEVIALASLWDLALEGEASGVRGVDSTDAVDDACEAALALARFTGGAVAISGEIDLVTDGRLVARSHGGSPLMTRVTGSGCSLGGVCAVYAAVAPSPFVAALCAVNAYNLAGQRAQDAAQAPGTFQAAFIDELFKASPEDLANTAFELVRADDCSLKEA